MTYRYNLSNTVATGADFLFRLKSNLVAGGWLVKSSSDGVTLNSTGDQITSAGTGAGGMSVANAFFRIQCPLQDSITREFTFQVSAAGGANWRVKYSTSAGFITGATSTRTPSATDEKIIYGGGTDAAPTFASACTNASTSAQYVVGDGGDGYSFFALQTTTGTINSIFFMDHMDSPSSGDLDPVVIFASPSSTSLTFNGIIAGTAATAPFAWLGKGFSYQSFTNVSLLMPWKTAAVTSAKNLGPNPYTGNDNLINVFYGINTGNGGSIHGYKGKSHLIMLNMNTHAQATTTNGKSRVQLGDFYFPWDSSTVPSL